MGVRTNIDNSAGVSKQTPAMGVKEAAVCPGSHGNVCHKAPRDTPRDRDSARANSFDNNEQLLGVKIITGAGVSLSPTLEDIGWVQL